jgi:hypothetical protein
MIHQAMRRMTPMVLVVLMMNAAHKQRNLHKYLNFFYTIEEKMHNGFIENDTRPFSEIIKQLPGTSDDWSNAATTFDVTAWVADSYASAIVILGGIMGVALPAPLIAVGLPEVPLVTGLGEMALAELYAQPVLKGGNALATVSFFVALVSETKSGTTCVEQGKISTPLLNSFSLTAAGWMIPEAFLSLAIQSASLGNDLKITSVPFPNIP